MPTFVQCSPSDLPDQTPFRVGGLTWTHVGCVFLIVAGPENALDCGAVGHVVFILYIFIFLLQFALRPFLTCIVYRDYSGPAGDDAVLSLTGVVSVSWEPTEFTTGICFNSSQTRSERSAHLTR